MDTRTLEPGQIIDREHKVERLLSQGGMGAVYVVAHLTTGKRRALKGMLSHLVRDQASRDRFERESRIGARIESDNVVEVVNAGVDEATGLPLLVMERLDGVDLDDCSLDDCSLVGADLHGASLTGVPTSAPEFARARGLTAASAR